MGYRGSSFSDSSYAEIASAKRPFIARAKPRLLRIWGSLGLVALSAFHSSIAWSYWPFFPISTAWSYFLYISTAGVAMAMMPPWGMFTNSGRFTARFAAVEFSIRMAGLSLPSASMWVRYIWVYGERALEEKT